MGEETTSSREMRVQGRRSFAAGLAALLAISALAACGSKDPQNANEPVGDYPVEVTTAKFPTRQRLAEVVDLELVIENTGDETIPDLAVTIYTGDEKADGPFNVRSDQEGLADPNRPVWVLENDFPKLLEEGETVKDLDEVDEDGNPVIGTAGAETAATDTYAFGPLEAGETVSPVWKVTPVEGGTFTVHYEIAGGLDGNAKAVTDDGSPVEGEFVATISTKPPKTKVTDDGRIVED